MAIDWDYVARQYEESPVKEPIKASGPKIRRAPSTDQLKARRELQRKADLGDSMSRETEIAQLLRKAGSAQSLAEQKEFVRQAEELKSEGIEARRASNEWKAEDAVIRDTLVPGVTHELHTAATDWITDLDTSYDPKEASQKMVAEASLWYGRVSDEVKSYGEEYDEQARGLARRLAGQFGDSSDVAERAFLDETSRLRATAVRSGLIVEANDDSDAAGDDEQDEDGLSATAASQLAEVGQEGYPTDVFSTLGENTGVNGALPPEATSSNRAPALQELKSGGDSWGSDVVPVNDPGLGKTDNLTGANESRPGEDHASKGTFPVSGNKKESSMQAQCPTCGGHGRVAVRAAGYKEAASGLPQIDQVADPKDNPSATPYPADVAFPWVLNPQAQIPAAINQAEQQIAERQKRAGSVTAAGDYSGWAGDKGARGTDYPGEQNGQYPAPSTSEGYTDPVYGNGGDKGNQPLLPYGHEEADDYTNKPAQWAPGQPSQDDNGWRETVQSDQGLANAISYVQQRYQAHLRQN